MIEIKHKTTGEVLLEVDSDTLSGADLRGANLRWANLRDANLRGANLRYANTTGASGIKLPTLQSQKESRQMEISGRLPTEDDANEEGNVYVVGCNVLSKWNAIDANDTWSPLPRLPKSRDELVQDLLDAIDDWNTTGRMDVSHGYRVVKAREALR